MNRLMLRTLPNGVTTQFTYDSRDTTEMIVHRKPDQSILASAVYERQGNGEPTRITREDGTYTLYGYDTAHRLTSEERRAFNGVALERIDYTYDVDGKRTSKTTGGATAGYTYGAGQRLTQAGAQTLTYDSGGRVQTMGGLAFSYTNSDQFASVSDAASGYAETFQNDALGRRIKGTSGGQERRFVTAPMVGAGLDAPHIIADGAGQPLSTYVYQGSVPLMRINAAGQPEYYLTDAMGSVIGLADSSAAPVATFRYDGFGTPTVMTGTPSTAPGGDYRFQAHWQESATGLYHMRARDYDPRTGRFLTRDPEPYSDKEPESLMPYAFANNNPMYYSDPTGLFTLVETMAATGIQAGKRAPAAVSAFAARRAATKFASEFLKDFFLEQLELLMPWNPADLFGGGGPRDAGRRFEELMRDAICGIFKAPSIFWWQTPLTAKGEPTGSGQNCARDPSMSYGGQQAGGSRPDLVISINPPFDGKKWRRGVAPVEFKLSGKTFYNSYVRKGAKQRRQFAAIAGYAHGYSYTKTAVFVSFFKGGKVQGRVGKAPDLFARFLKAQAIKKQFIPLFFYAL